MDSQQQQGGPPPASPPSGGSYYSYARSTSTDGSGSGNSNSVGTTTANGNTTSNASSTHTQHPPAKNSYDDNSTTTTTPTTNPTPSYSHPCIQRPNYSPPPPPPFGTSYLGGPAGIAADTASGVQQQQQQLQQQQQQQQQQQHPPQPTTGGSIVSFSFFGRMMGGSAAAGGAGAGEDRTSPPPPAQRTTMTAVNPFASTNNLQLNDNTSSSSSSSSIEKRQVGAPTAVIGDVADGNNDNNSMIQRQQQQQQQINNLTISPSPSMGLSTIDSSSFDGGGGEQRQGGSRSGGMMMMQPPQRVVSVIGGMTAAGAVMPGGNASAAGAGGGAVSSAAAGGGGDTSGNATAINDNDANNNDCDSSLLLGLEELERQQADVELRRARDEWMKQQQHPQQQQMGGGGGGGKLPPRSPPPDIVSTVPSQIHLLDKNDEDQDSTSLSAGENTTTVTKPGLQRVVSIDKLRGSVQDKLRRLRSWSQELRTETENPAENSVDSTHPMSVDDGGGGGGGPPTQQQLQQYNQRQLIKSSLRKYPTATTTTTTEIVESSSSALARSSSKKNSTTTIRTRMTIPQLDVGEISPLVYGYLHKLGRNGHWQCRFFETDGERLTYYKNVKRTNALATLDLLKVGEIAIDKTDPDECTFTIQVRNRPYFLRAENKARCNDWVIVLNRAREARMNVGNIQFVTTKSLDGMEGAIVVGNITNRVQADSDEYDSSSTSPQPCMVISALRPRTKAVRDDGELAMQNSVPPPDLFMSESGEVEEQVEVLNWSKRTSPKHQVGIVASTTGGAGGDTASMAKWQKRHSIIHHLSLRILRWARSITQQADACRNESDVVVVPTHVAMAISQQQQQQQPSSSSHQGTALSTTGLTNERGVSNISGARQRQPMSTIPVLNENTSGTDTNTDMRSRLSTDSGRDSPGFDHSFL